MHVSERPCLSNGHGALAAFPTKNLDGTRPPRLAKDARGRVPGQFHSAIKLHISTPVLEHIFYWSTP